MWNLYKDEKMNTTKWKLRDNKETSGYHCGDGRAKQGNRYKYKINMQQGIYHREQSYNFEVFLNWNIIFNYIVHLKLL